MANVIKITDEVNNDSSIVAASAKAVKTAYDKATSAENVANTANANSGVTAASYGPSANASPAHGGSFSVPYFTVNAKGKITAASTKTITLPSASSTSNAATATRLQTARTITVKTTTTGSGDKKEPIYNQSGSVSFDGSSNVTISVPTLRAYNCNCNCDCGDNCFVHGKFKTLDGEKDVSELTTSDYIIDILGVKHKIIYTSSKEVKNKKIIKIGESIFTEDHVFLDSDTFIPCSVSMKRANDNKFVHDNLENIVGEYIVSPIKNFTNYEFVPFDGQKEYIIVVESKIPVWAYFSGTIVELAVG